ncbi:MAG: OmpA family protein [Maribacter arcticus]|uniref:OmpA family protein n=3 Tax=Maribacter arcticus TaxID=561365 RepID=UPI003001F19C
MRTFINLSFLIFVVFIHAQDFQANLTSEQSFASESIPEVEIEETDSEAFERTAESYAITHKTFENIEDVQNGYYVITGIFSNSRNLKSQVRLLNEKGFDSGYFQNPENNLYYLYLNHYESWKTALQNCSTKFDNRYAKEFWILKMANSKLNSELIPVDEVTYENLEYSKQGTLTLNKNVAPKSVEKDFQTNLTSEQSFDFESIPEVEIEKTDAQAFERTAESYAITHKTFENIEDVQNGYYVITGIFSKSRNLKSQVRKLNKKGFDSGYFQNPENNLYYLYLNHYESWEKALEDCSSKFDNRYTKDFWILKMANSKLDTELIPLEEITYDVLENSEQSTTTLKKHVAPKSVEKESKNKIVHKADEYFNKMWYEEAAKLYELALNKNNEGYTYEVIKKAGDAHYFNTDMEKAYKWYTILYENYESEMSSDYLFKYAHSIKGTGNYKRSKRLMKLYNRKLAGKKIEKNSQLNEIVLDGLLRMDDRFDVKNINVNSKYSEFSPMYYNGDEIVYASAKDSSIFNTRRYKWNNQPYLDLYVAKINEESQDLKNAIKFSNEINTKYHEASVAFSPDNKTMYFTRNNYGKKLKRDKNGINNLKIYRSKKINGEWTKADEVSFNSDDYSTGHPALSKDGKQLYFVSDMPGSIGETDIFVVDVLGDGSFSSPRNLGPEINTEHKEMFPFINEKKLYFSSDGHVGLGGLDVFEVAFDDEIGFLEVRNVGKPINSKKDDFSFIVNEDTQEGYFASNRAGGKGDDDIYSFKTLQIEEIPTNTNAISGIVTELVGGDIMPNALVQLLDENNIKLKEMETDENGSFVFEDLESDKRYVLKTTKGSYFDDTRDAATKHHEIVNVDVSMRKLNDMIAVEDGIRKLKTEMIYFNFDKSFIRKDASLELDKLVAVMNDSPNMVIKIESHTDSRGDAIYNKYLSDKRAKSTREYIIARGIDPSRIESAIGFGEEQLLNGCNGSVRCTEEQHYLNRRSEFIIVDM